MECSCIAALLGVTSGKHCLGLEAIWVDLGGVDGVVVDNEAADALERRPETG